MTDLRFVQTKFPTAQHNKRQASRACDTCRRNKKRCMHDADSGEPTVRPGPRRIVSAASEAHRSSSRQPNGPTPTDDVPAAAPPQRQFELSALIDPTFVQSKIGPDVAGVPSHQAPSDVTHDIQGAVAGDQVYDRFSFVKGSTGLEPQRFIGDLNPEAVLLSSGAKPHPETSPNAVGLWQSRPSRRDEPPENSSANIFRHAPPLAKKLLLPMIEDQSSKVLPPSIDLAAFETVYFKRFHPILPAIDEPSFNASLPGTAARALQYQSICLMASSDPSLAGHLHLPGRDHIMTPTQFAQEIAGCMRLSIEMALVSDKLILIYTFATMSLYSWNHQSMELSSQFFARAIDISTTIGLHLQRDHDTESSQLDKLFCYLWSLDKFHAAVHGRPTIMHERDIERSVATCLEAAQPAFKMFVKISSILGDVISLYRPHAARSFLPSDEILSFETIADTSDALDLTTDTLCKSSSHMYLLMNTAIDDLVF